jgi:hypothetical protein
MSDAIPLHFAAKFSAADPIKSAGKLLNTALKDAVRITRREQNQKVIVLICVRTLRRMTPCPDGRLKRRHGPAS